jgi:hypothetical protein
MGGFDPFGYHLADFKAVQSVRKGTVNLVGSHDYTPVNRWMLRAVRNSSGAVGRQQPSRLVQAKGGSEYLRSIFIVPRKRLLRRPQSGTVGRSAILRSVKKI